MTSPSLIKTAFDHWASLELATRYCEPCPQSVMDHLVECESQAFDALMAMPVSTADDMLLKVYPVLLREMEPKPDAPPLRLGESRSYHYDPSFYEQLNGHLSAVSTSIAAAMEAPAIAAGRQEASA